jgi:hypothetical protein
VEISKATIKEFSEAQYDRARVLVASTNYYWKKPPGGLWKINCDAAINKDTMRMGVGIVIRDEGGRL